MQIGLAHPGIFMNAIEMRLVPAAREIELGGPSCRAGTEQTNRLDESGQCSAAAAGGLMPSSASDRIGNGGDAIKRLGGDDRPDAGQQLNDAETGDAVARIFGKPQQRQHVLDVCGFKEFQPAKFDEWDVAAGQFDLERTAVVRGAKQYGLRFEREPRLAALQNPLDHVARLVGFVAHADDFGPLGGFALRPQVFGEAFFGKTDHGIRRREDRLRRAIILLQRHDLGPRREVTRKVEDIAHRRGAERIDRLGSSPTTVMPLPFGLSAKRTEACSRLVS